MGPPLRQYFFAGDVEERPYNRVTRSWIYASAKGQNNMIGFGSQVDHNETGRMHIVPSMYPTLKAAGAGETVETTASVARVLEPKPAKPAARKTEVEAPAPLFEVAAAVGPTLAVEFVATLVENAPIPAAADVVAPASRLLEAGAEQAREVYARTRVTSDTFRNAMTETANLTTRGALEVNGKVIDALRGQSDAAFDLWRSTLTAGSLSEAIVIAFTVIKGTTS